MALYNSILQGLYNSNNFYNYSFYRTFENYLQSLQYPAKILWESYRSDQVRVDYSDPSIQAAYLIRYYPHYAKMTFDILDILYQQNLLNNLRENTLQISFFGAGPCPEIAGLSGLKQKFAKKACIMLSYMYFTLRYNHERDDTCGYAPML